MIQIYKVTIVALLLLINARTVFSHHVNLRNNQQLQISPLRTKNDEHNDDTPKRTTSSGLRNQTTRDSISRKPPRTIAEPTDIPTLAPSMSPSSNPSDTTSLEPTYYIADLYSSAFTANCTILTIDVQTDYFPEETSVEILHATKDIRYWEYSNFTQPNYKYSFETCLDQNECYMFKIYDSNENGNCCAAGFGYFSLTWDGRLRETNNIGIFGFESEFRFGGGCSP